VSTFIRSVSATSGFLQQCKVEFAPGLTCIIGARGTCKSTLLESIRFAFDSNAQRVRALVAETPGRPDAWSGMIRTTLGAGSIRCEVASENDSGTTSLLIERDVGNAPRVFQDGIREHADADVLHNIEIFSQGDLQRIAEDENDELRLALIDRPNARRIEALRCQRQQLTGSLTSVGPTLRTLRATIQSIRQELQPAGALREDLRRVTEACPPLPVELERERDLFERRRRILDALEEAGRLRKAALEQLASLKDVTTRLAALATRVRSEALIDARAAVDAVSSLEASFESLRTGARSLAAADIAAAQQLLRTHYEENNAAYYRLREGQQAVNEALKQQQHLQRQLEHLDSRQKDLDDALAEEANLTLQRQEHRAQISAIDDELYSLRIAEIEAINSEHGNTIHLTLRAGSGAPRYVERVSALLSGSRIRSQDEVAAALAETFAPTALIDIAESGTGERMAELLSRDIGQMNRVVAHLSDHPDLYSLEAEIPAARLEITFYDKGEPKPVETLSRGQRATALLPLILRPLPYPLLFDQPEDDLDNQFIFSSLITTIDKLKHQRQLIFVTHNANIPVLGGADQVVVMRMRTPVLADAPRVGTVDERKQDILDLLEGGAEAFLMREERYGSLLRR
jgi:hypothetical protein